MPAAIGSGLIFTDFRGYVDRVGVSILLAANLPRLSHSVGGITPGLPQGLHTRRADGTSAAHGTSQEATKQTRFDPTVIPC